LVEHQRHAHGLEWPAGQFGPVLRGRGRQLRAFDMREVATAALQHMALFDQARAAITLQAFARGAHPAVVHEGLAIGGLEGRNDALLQSEQVSAHGAGVEGGCLSLGHVADV
jgi:hypothetical protein